MTLCQMDYTDKEHGLTRLCQGNPRNIATRRANKTPICETCYTDLVATVSRRTGKSPLGIRIAIWRSNL